MLNKVKNFYKKHRLVINTIGGTLVIVGSAVIFKKGQKTVVEVMDERVNRYKDVMEGLGAVYEEGHDIPTATKEIATKFLERGDTYQIDIWDDDVSVIYVMKNVLIKAEANRID